MMDMATGMLMPLVMGSLQDAETQAELANTVCDFLASAGITGMEVTGKSGNIDIYDTAEGIMIALAPLFARFGVPVLIRTSTVSIDGISHAQFMPVRP